MKAFFSVSNQQEFYSELQQKIGNDYYFDGFESHIRVHPRIGQGQVHRFQFDSGLELQFNEFLPQEPIILGGEIKYRCLGFCWTVCGCSNYTIENQDISLKPQQNMIFYGNDISTTFEMNANHKVAFVGLGLEKYLSQPKFTQQIEELPTSLRMLIENNHLGFFYQNNTTTPEMSVVLHQILNCPYQGFTKKLYLESKANELFALNIDSLEQNINKTTYKKYKPKKSEVDRLNYAKEILTNNLDQPPTLNSLARQVGLNEYKLKQGFRFVFNTTVFGYLHDYRMMRSRLLLESGNMNVTEVAQAIGYSNLSHFATAFRKKFGVNPSVFKKR